ncbi:hypothetical protein, partial [Listeria monocytogenes]|uniref:hypothetical protein n=1 Tax=Listeria monocytogenes TaxID=1639 RepID=UPI002FDC0688
MARRNTPNCFTRRYLLRIGGLGFAGLNLPELFRAQAARAGPAEAGPTGVGRVREGTGASPIKSCILLYQSGGPSQLD